MFTVNRPGQGGKKEESLLDQVMQAITDGADRAVGNTPKKEEKEEDKSKGVLEKVADKLDQDLHKATGGMIAADKKGDKEEEKGKAKGSGFDDLKKIGGAFLEVGKELLPEAGKGLFARLENSPVLLGAEQAMGAMPKVLSGLAQEGRETGKTAFGLSNESRAQTSLGIPSFSPDRQPAPAHSTGSLSLGMQVVQAFKDLRNLGQELGEDRMPVRLSVLGRQQGVAQAPGLDQGAAIFPARAMT